MAAAKKKVVSKAKKTITEKALFITEPKFLGIIKIKAKVTHQLKGSFTCDGSGKVIKTSKEVIMVRKGRDGSYTASVKIPAPKKKKAVAKKVAPVKKASTKKSAVKKRVTKKAKDSASK